MQAAWPCRLRLKQPRRSPDRLSAPPHTTIAPGWYISITYAVAGCIHTNVHGRTLRLTGQLDMMEGPQPLACQCRRHMRTVRCMQGFQENHNLHLYRQLPRRAGTKPPWIPGGQRRRGMSLPSEFSKIHRIDSLAKLVHCCPTDLSRHLSKPWKGDQRVVRGGEGAARTFCMMGSKTNL